MRQFFTQRQAAVMLGVAIAVLCIKTSSTKTCHPAYLKIHCC